MKKILLIIIIYLFSSCNKTFLDVVPQDQLSDATFWKTKADADLALAGAYNNWEVFYFSILFLDASADNAYDQHFSWKKLANGSFLPTDNLNIVSPSDYSYGKIRKYNNFLTKIEGVDMDDAIKERYKAEVRFLRAYDYFIKTQFYGDVPLVTELVPADVNLPRTPVAEVQQFILDELDDISKILPAQNNIESQGHVTKGAAIALKARLELYMGKYDDAMNDAKAVIDMGKYELYPDYRKLFLPESDPSNKEAILTINFANNNLPGIWMPQMLQPPSWGGFSSLSATKSLTDAYETTLGKTIDDPASGYDPENPFANRDLRLSTTFVHPGELYGGKIYNTLDRTLPGSTNNPDFHREGNAPRSGANLLKYILPVSIADMQSTAKNIMVIRLAEMYLTYAEAAVELNKNKDIALQYINQLRSRANLPPATELTRELVRRERRVELAMEGLRYWDIKRWDIGATALNGPSYGMRNGTVDMTTGKVTYFNDYIKLDDLVFRPERKYLLPIPQSEIDVTGVNQNPGY
jgi:starch-binding outer membrane protein, SusD/RagB family